MKKANAKENNIDLFKYEYNYTINLLAPGEEGFIESYLNDNHAESENQRIDPSDFYNFGIQINHYK